VDTRAGSIPARAGQEPGANGNPEEQPPMEVCDEAAEDNKKSLIEKLNGNQRKGRLKIRV